MPFREDVKMSLSVIFAFVLISTMTTPVGVHKNEMTDINICPNTMVLPPNITLVETPEVINYVTCIYHSDAEHNYFYDSIPASQCTLQNHDFRMVSEKNGWKESHNGKALEAMMCVEERWPKCSNDSMEEWFDCTIQSDGPALWQSLREFIAPFIEYLNTMPKIWKVHIEDVVKPAMIDEHDGFSANTSHVHLDLDDPNNASNNDEFQNISTTDDFTLHYDLHYDMTVRSGYNDVSGASVDVHVSQEDDVFLHDEMTRYSLIRRQGYVVPDCDEDYTPSTDDDNDRRQPVLSSPLFNLGVVSMNYGVLERKVTSSRNERYVQYEFNLSLVDTLAEFFSPIYTKALAYNSWLVEKRDDLIEFLPPICKKVAVFLWNIDKRVAAYMLFHLVLLRFVYVLSTRRNRSVFAEMGEQSHRLSRKKLQYRRRKARR